MRVWRSGTSAASIMSPKTALGEQQAMT